jgi:hypothetical protein
MTDHDHDEARLQALFDETASEPDRMQLTKLRARAMDVPAGRKRRPFWTWLAPALALAAGALLVVAAQRGPLHTAPVTKTAAPVVHENTAPAPVALETARPEPTRAAPTKPAPEDPELFDELDEPLAGIGLLGDDGDDATSSQEQDLDVWLSAADALSEDG